MSATDSQIARWDAVMMRNYGSPAVALVSGQGCYVTDADGRRLLDLIAGIATSSLGHAHPALIAAVTEQVGTIAHTSNLVIHEPGLRLAETLVRLVGAPARVFFANSGTEANEAAFKLVRKARPGRRRIVATERGFHGRTMGSLALTGKAAIREPFGPFGVDVDFIPYGDAEALAAAVTSDTAAILLEPTQGEAGVVSPPAGYLAAARAAADAAGALLWLDEVQSGVGRTGHWFAHQADGVRPDVLTLAKGLGGGLPIGACIGLGATADVFVKGDHGSTFGGNPVAAAAAYAVLSTIERDGLLKHVRDVSADIQAGLTAIDHPLLTEVRARGLWFGLCLALPLAGVLETTARDDGFLINTVAPDVIRLAPPLIITAEQARTFVTRLPGLLDRLAASAAATAKVGA